MIHLPDTKATPPNFLHKENTYQADRCFPKIYSFIKNNLKARIIRDDVIVYNGAVNTLQHEKDQVKEVKKDMDCGITLENCQDYKENDIIEIYELVEIKR